MNRTQRIVLPLLKNMPLILFVGIFVLFSLLDQRFFAVANISNIVLSSAFVGTVAVGMTFVLLTGGIDLSVGATMYISGAVIVILLEKGWPMAIVLPLGLVAGTLWGGLNALLITRLNIIPFMATLGTLTAGRGLGLLITESRHIAVPDEMRFGAERILGLPIPILIFASVILVAFIVLSYTPYGRQIYAMGNDVEAAKKAGLNTRRLTASVYVISGFCAALGAIIAISQQGSVSSSFGRGVEFRAIAAAVLGGTSLFGGVGNVFPGTVIGVLLMQMIQNGLIYLQVDLYLQDMVTALVIFFAVFIDALRAQVIRKLERRNIRVEKGTATVRASADPAPS